MIGSPMTDLTDRSLIVEEDIRKVSVGATLRIHAKALVTPLAEDLARERHIRLERAAPALKVAIGADHGGFEMKEALKGVLKELGYEYQDFGTDSGAAVD